MSLKTAIQSLTLKSKTRKFQRIKRVCSISDAKSVGFVCYLENEDQWKTIQPAVQHFQTLGSKVFVLAIYPAKVKPLWYVETMNTLMCSLNEFGIGGIPRGQKVEDFLKERFDLLIDCDFAEHYSTEYLSRLSPAGFKVAIDTERNREYFDLLIKMEEPELEFFIEQALFYLSNFKTER